MSAQDNMILILDFGSQYTQLIARRIRESKVYCEILPHTVTLERIRECKPQGIILSGGPASVYDRRPPITDSRLYTEGIPVLGICYGMQLMAHQLKGIVTKSQSREYGRADLRITRSGTDLFRDLSESEMTVWMSHGDRIKKIPTGFEVIGRTDHSPYAVIQHRRRKLYALQFHPEVVHTAQGTRILQNFVYHVCGCQPIWTMRSFRERAISQIRSAVGREKVICALSGGVDSSVAGVLVHEAVGKQLTCVFVNNGLLRENESKSVLKTFRKYLKLNIRYMDSSNLFIKRLSGVANPEKKRKIIGNTFIRVFEQEARKLQGVRYLVQGTLYPDVIESVSVKGPSAIIKTHHNVGGLPRRMKFQIIEPLRELFKDEVRALGKEMGIPDILLLRHPFPGPGLAVRIVGAVTKERLDVLRQADTIVEQEIRRSGWYEKIWQVFAVLLPVRSVGVMGDQRTYENVAAIRAVHSRDGMTADWVQIPPEVLGRISNRIINEVKGINRVVYDISSKPPSTIEWE